MGGTGIGGTGIGGTVDRVVVALLQSITASPLIGGSSQFQSNNVIQNFRADSAARIIAAGGDLSTALLPIAAGTEAEDVTSTTLGAGTILQIASGGMRLPVNMLNETEEDVRRKRQQRQQQQ